MAHQRRGKRIAEDEGRHDHGLDGTDRIDEDRLVTGSRKPAELHRDEQDQHDAEPEIRDGEAGKRHDIGGVVDPGILLHRSQNTDRDADDHREEHRHDGKLNGDRQFLSDQFQHRLVGSERNAEIARHHTAQPVEVLNRHRIVETIFLAQEFDRSRIALFTGHGQNRVTGQKLLQ
ncbi:hypothetical protein D3C80_825520 [compost metagenome]